MSGIRFQKKKISAEERGSADEDHGGDKIKYGNGSGNRSPLVKTKIQRSVVCYLTDLFSTTTTKTTGHSEEEEQEENGTYTQETHRRQRLSSSWSRCQI